MPISSRHNDTPTPADTPETSPTGLMVKSEMQNRQIWAKASLGIKCSLSTISGPLWIGLDTESKEVLASSDWAVPTKPIPLREWILERQAVALAEEIRHAEIVKKGAGHLCFAAPTISVEGSNGGESGQLGLVLERGETPSFKNLGWLENEDVQQLLWAVQGIGLVITVQPRNRVFFPSQSLPENPAGE